MDFSQPKFNGFSLSYLLSSLEEGDKSQLRPYLAYT